jgi:hypothetical protein
MNYELPWGRFEGVEVEIHSFLASAVDRSEWVIFTPLPPYSGGNNLRYPLDRRLGNAQSRFGRRDGEKNSCLGRESNPSLSIRSLVII